MATQVAPLGLRLFLEGIEVPVVSAQVVIQPGSPAAATIQIVPTDAALLFLPRTCVHLFYLDNEFVQASSTERKDTFGRSREDSNRFEVADEQYKLLFLGEITGYTYMKSSDQRSMVLQCMDLSSYWDTCYQWFADYSVGGDGFTDRHHNFVGAGQFVFDSVAAGTRWIVGSVLTSKPDNPRYKDLNGLLGGYIHLLEVISGIRPKKGSSYKSFRGANDFFSMAELRYNLSGMIGAVNADTTSARIFAGRAFLSWLKNGMASAGSLVSFRDILKLVGQYIFHEVYPNPAAFYVGEGTRIQDRVPELVNQTSSGKQAFQSMREALDRVESAISVLNDAYDDNLETVKGSESIDMMTKGRDSLDAAIEVVKASSAADSPNLLQVMLLASANLLTAITSFRQAARGQGDPVEFTIPRTSLFRILSLLQAAADDLSRAQKVNAKRRRREKAVEVETGPHLFNQLILPETWMLAPPRCNVLFPDSYFQLNYSRNFMREVSRLHVHGGLGIIGGSGRNAKILGSHYLAPNIKDVTGKMARQTIFRSSRVILPHEIHSGIIPKLDWVSEGHRWGVRAAKAVGKNTQGKKISYIQRLSNFQFFNHRWAARQMSVQAKFTPQLVLGFPGVVIDRSTLSIGAILASDNVSDQANFLLPTAYVGKIANIQHNVHQGGGVTSVVYTHARTHRGLDDEFLGVVSRESKEAQRQTEDVDIQDLLSAKEQGVPVADLQLKLVQLFVQNKLTAGAELTNATVVQVDNTGTNENFTEAQLSTLGVSSQDFLRLQIIQSGIGSVTTTVSLPSAFRVQLEYRPLPGKFVRPEGALPFEELVRPRWYDPTVWTNDSISAAVYLPLLGTRAVTDDSQIGDPSELAELIKVAVRESGVPTDVSVEEDDSGNLVLKMENKIVASLGLNLAVGTSVETAIDGLTTLYGTLKKRDLDVQGFIDDYTKRPVASLVEIMGDSDLQYAREGNTQGLAAGEIIPRQADGSIPFEGFHTRAFGPYNVDVKHRASTSAASSDPQAGKDALVGLIPDDKLGEYLDAGTVINRGKAKKPIKIPAHLDPRGRAQARVRAYAFELSVTRGILAT